MRNVLSLLCVFIICVAFVPIAFAIDGLPAGSKKLSVHNEGKIDFYGGAPNQGAYSVKRGSNKAVLIKGTVGKTVNKIDVYRSSATQFNVYFTLEDSKRLSKLQAILDELKNKVNILEKDNKKLKGDYNSDLAKTKQKVAKAEDESKKIKAALTKCTKEVAKLKN